MTVHPARDAITGVSAWPEAIARLRAAWPDLLGDDDIQTRARAASSDDHVRLASDDDLLAWGCLLGSRAAIHELEERCLHPAMPRLRAMGFQPATVDDIIADARAKLLVRSGERAPALARHQGRGSLAGYVRAIVVRHAIDLLRSQRTGGGREVEEIEEIDEIAQFATVSLDSELVRLATGAAVTAAFRRAWAELPPHVRLLLSQQVIDRLSVDELGAIYGVHRATASRRCISAREMLLARLRAALHDTLGVNTGTADSILRNAGSQISEVLGEAVGDSDPHAG